ncbi:similar to cytochrome P450 monooxygenase [Colletotrichum tofieldiae]|nr:similar to cytochrome P450 monooxygenase [Colletotrichum tofieldiae]GKT71146.1 similar to cytochrome P450 monooxygenase [Colletotrichum tofieldiae]
MALLAILATFCVFLLSREVYRLFRVISDARAVGLPIVFVPVDQANLVWLVLSASCRFRIQKILPAWLWERVAIAVPGWELFQEMPYLRNNPTSRRRWYTDVNHASFTLVGLRRFEVWTADPLVASEILGRIHDFEQPRGLELLLGKFGPNVVTSNGDQWARHRKIVAAVINERISKQVFNESIRHSRDILQETFVTTTSTERESTVNAQLLFAKLTEVTLNVLIGAGIGDKFPWIDEKGQQPVPPYEMTYKDALHIYLNNAFGLAMLPSWLLNHWPSWAPAYQRVRRVERSMTEFRMRNLLLLDQERRSGMAGDRREASGRPDLLTLLAEASRSSSSIKSSDHVSPALSEDEVVSNLFAFTAGGFKTIAGALNFAVVLLARYPLWHGWLVEEIDGLFPAEVDSEEQLEYADTFARAVRLFAFVMETMRLYGSASRLYRETSGPQLLRTSSGSTIRLPTKARLFVNSIALHHLPSWRDVNRQSDPAGFTPDRDTPDEDTFRPSRTPTFTHQKAHLCPGRRGHGYAQDRKWPKWKS